MKDLRDGWGSPAQFQTPSGWRSDTPSRLLDGVQPWLCGCHDYYWECRNCWQQDHDLSLSQNEEMKGKKEEIGWNEKWLRTAERELEILRRMKEMSCLSLFCFWGFFFVSPRACIISLSCCYLNPGLTTERELWELTFTEWFWWWLRIATHSIWPQTRDWIKSIHWLSKRLRKKSLGWIFPSHSYDFLFP